MRCRPFAVCLVPLAAACGSAATTGEPSNADRPFETLPPVATATQTATPATIGCPTIDDNGATVVDHSSVAESARTSATPLAESAPGATCIGIAVALPEPEIDQDVVIDTTAPNGYVPTTTPAPIIDTGTVPRLLDSPDVAQVELTYAGSVVAARFGPTTSGGVKGEILVDGVQAGGAGAPTADLLDGAISIVFLPDGAIAFAFVGAPGHQETAQVLADDVAVTTSATGVWTSAGARTIGVAVVPAGTRHVEVVDATDGAPIAFDLPA